MITGFETFNARLYRAAARLGRGFCLGEGRGQRMVFGDVVAVVLQHCWFLCVFSDICYHLLVFRVKLVEYNLLVLEWNLLVS